MKEELVQVAAGVDVGYPKVVLPPVFILQQDARKPIMKTATRKRNGLDVAPGLEMDDRLEAGAVESARSRCK